MNIPKIDVLACMLNSRRGDDDLTVILKIKEFYVSGIPSIAIMCDLRRRCGRDKFRIDDSNSANKNLKSIPLLFSEFNALIVDIVRHDKQRGWDILIKPEWVAKITEVTCSIKNLVELLYAE